MSGGQQGQPDAGGAPGTSFVPGVAPEAVVASHPLIGPPPRPGLVGAVGRFELLRKLGEGGMGIVFLARDTMPPKPAAGETPMTDSVDGQTQAAPARGAMVALKLLRPELAANSRAVEYFLKEASHAQRLQHPNILPVLESSGQAEGAWMAMLLAEGGSLAQLLEGGRPLSEEVILQVAKQVASALEYAHGRGIIHRDIKPRNILFDSCGRAYLSDFGLARSLLNDVVLGIEQTEIAGTPQYQSPTAACGEHGDTRDDIYSFGAVLYEMLTGTPPYRGKTREEVLQQIRNGPPPTILSLTPKASPGLAKIAEWAMARDLRDRYAHIKHVLEDLELVGRGEPPKGPHGSLAVQGTSVHSAPGLFKQPRIVAGIALVLLVPAIAGSIWLLKPSLRLWRNIELPEVHDWSSARLGGVKAMAEPVFHLVKDNKLVTISARGQVLAEWVPPSGGHRLGLNVVEDVNGDGSADAIPHWCKGEESVISVIKEWRMEIYRYAARSQIVSETPSTERPKTVLGAIGAFDLDHDGRFEVLADVITGKEQPRGVCCIRFPGEELLWTYQFGPWPAEVDVIDLDGDGVDEVLVGSAGVDNGAEGPDGTDDKHSYVFALDINGRLKWCRCFGGLYTRARPVVADLDNDGKKDILVWTTAPHEFTTELNQQETGQVIRLDNDGEELQRYDAQCELRGCVVADLNGDGKREVLVTDRKGFLHVLDSNLQLVRHVRVTENKFETVELLFGGVGDITGDNSPEVVLLSSQIEFVSGLNPGDVRGAHNVRAAHELAVIALSARLEPLGKFLVAEKWPNFPAFQMRLADVDGDRRSEVLFFGPSLVMLKWGSRLGMAMIE